MTTENKEPYHKLGGYQNVVTGTVLNGDLATFPWEAERIVESAEIIEGADIEHLALMGVNIYRKLPVAKQGGERAETVAKASVAADLRSTASVASAPPQSSSILPTEASARKRVPIASGFLDYFPRSVAAVAAVSLAGNEQHNPGKPLHWDRSKSGDEADALMRHFMERGKVDSDGLPHVVKCAWRAMAMAEKWLEAHGGVNTKLTDQNGSV